MAHLICCCCRCCCSTLPVLLLPLSWRWRIAALSLIAASPPSASCRVLLLSSTPAVSPSSSSSAPPPPPRLPHVLLLTVCCPPLLDTSCPHVSSHRRARHRSLLLLLLLLLLFCISFPCSSCSPSPSSRSCSACQIAGQAVHKQETCVPVPLSGLRGRQQRQAGGSSIEGRSHSDRHPRPTCCRCDRPQQLPFTTVDRVAAAAAAAASTPADHDMRLYMQRCDEKDEAGNCSDVEVVDAPVRVRPPPAPSSATSHAYRVRRYEGQRAAPHQQRAQQRQALPLRRLHQGLFAACHNGEPRWQCPHAECVLPRPHTLILSPQRRRSRLHS